MKFQIQSFVIVFFVLLFLTFPFILFGIELYIGFLICSAFAIWLAIFIGDYLAGR